MGFINRGRSPILVEKGLPTSDIRLRTSDFQLPTFDVRLRTSESFIVLSYSLVVQFPYFLVDTVNSVVQLRSCIIMCRGA